MKKKILLFGFLIFSLTAVLVSCEEDDTTQQVITPSNVSATVNALTDGSGTVTVTPTAEGANSFLVTFAEGVSFVVKVGESATHTYAVSGTYTITIVAYGQGLGNATTTQSVSVDIAADPNEALFGSWVMANEAGSLGVGPAPGDTSWFAIDGAGVTQRACYFNDAYVFGEDGSFMNVLGDETWLEGWQNGAADACGAPVAPHDGSTAATYSFDPTAGTLTLTGAGSYLGLPKAVNAGELPNVDVPDSVTYLVTLSEDGETMNVVIEAGAGVYWQYKMVKGDGSDVVVGDGGDGGDESGPTMAAADPTQDAGSVISMFSNVYDDVVVDTWRTEWSDATFEDVQVDGNDVKKYSNLNFVGIETAMNQIDASSMTHFRTDIWTSDATQFRIKLVDFGEDGAFDGGDDVEHEVVIDAPAQGEWVSLDIPLSDFTGLTKTSNIAQLIYSGDPSGALTVFIDNIYFYADGDTSGSTEPTTAAPDPTEDAGSVISMFSNVYSDVTVDTWRTDWSDATFEDVQVDGNDTKKYSNLNFVGIETVANQIDATTMTHFHTDFWTADATQIRIKLVDFGEDGAFDGGDDVEHEIVIDTPAQGEWVSVDIPLSDFTGLTKTANIAQLIYSGDPSGALTVFIDNVYFHN